MEQKPKDIHQVLGNLRRRITELSKGDYSRGYQDEWSNIKSNIESFAPDVIIQNLEPLSHQLKSISEETYKLVSNDPHEEINRIWEDGLDVDPSIYKNPTGESQRDLMRKEVKNLITQLDPILIKYSKSYLLDDVITYKNYNNTDAKQIIYDFQSDLAAFIEDMPPDQFALLFSGERHRNVHPINWVGRIGAFSYFLHELFGHNNIIGFQGSDRIDFSVAKKCFRFKGNLIDVKKIRHDTSKPNSAPEIDKAIKKLD